jgi:hypothetical protein
MKNFSSGLVKLGAPVVMRLLARVFSRRAGSRIDLRGLAEHAAAVNRARLAQSLIARRFVA